MVRAPSVQCQQQAADRGRAVAAIVQHGRIIGVIGRALVLQEGQEQAPAFLQWQRVPPASSASAQSTGWRSALSGRNVQQASQCCRRSRRSSF